MILGFLFYGIAAVMALVGLVELTSGPGFREPETLHVARAGALVGGSLSATFAGYVCQKLHDIHITLQATNPRPQFSNQDSEVFEEQMVLGVGNPVEIGVEREGEFDGPVGKRSYRIEQDGRVILDTVTGEKSFPNLAAAKQYVWGS